MVARNRREARRFLMEVGDPSVKRLIAIGLRLAAEEAPAKKKKATKPEPKK
jgi:hypothetical protein